MSKTFDFLDYLSSTMPRVEKDDNSELDKTKEILSTIPESTLPFKGAELINQTASRPSHKKSYLGSEYFKQWNGRVVSIESNDTFVAMVESVRATGEPPKVVRFNRKKVVIKNIELMSEGAPFYWTVGMFRNEHHSLEKLSEVRFKMVSKPSASLLARIGEDLEKLFDGISWME